VVKHFVVKNTVPTANEVRSREIANMKDWAQRSRTITMVKHRLVRTILILAMVLLAVSICPPLPLLAAPGSNPKAFWPAQIQKVHLGMQQYIVEKFLPPRSSGTMKFARDAKSYAYTYALDEQWSVATVYDRSGWTTINNPYNTMGFPNDKVIRLPRLLRHRNRIDQTYFPPFAPK
jgi:hypothetical protein